MTGFLLKKTFFDLWDNMFKLAAVNMCFLVSCTLLIIVSVVLPAHTAIQGGITVVGIVWSSCFLMMSARALSPLSDCRSHEFARLFVNFPSNLACGCAAALITAILGLLFFIVIPYYFFTPELINVIFAALSAWIFLFLPVVFQYLFAVRSRFEGHLGHIVKKVLMFFFDNPFFCVTTFFIAILMFVFSAFTLFLFPGPAGILLFFDEALRLRLLKYDWLEAQPPSPHRPAIPWNELLAADRETLGTRSFKNLIFPWKD
ncbi:MAG: hypothetical protein LBD22_06285 [Spirochaetaceae bacterium]|nr:hypothetical protein [Spirochaetaceae bacterium]